VLERREQSADSSGGTPRCAGQLVEHKVKRTMAGCVSPASTLLLDLTDRLVDVGPAAPAAARTMFS
jgi:hypothetical protein